MKNEKSHVHLKLITRRVWKEKIKNNKNSYLLEGYQIFLLLFQMGTDFLLLQIVILIKIIFYYLIIKQEYWIFKIILLDTKKAFWLIGNYSFYNSRLTNRTLINKKNFRIQFLSAYLQIWHLWKYIVFFLQRKQWLLFNGKIIRLSNKNKQTTLF